MYLSIGVTVLQKCSIVVLALHVLRCSIGVPVSQKCSIVVLALQVLRGFISVPEVFYSCSNSTGV